MQLGAIDHIAVRVDDPEALGRFLQDVLGLRAEGSASRRLYPLPGGQRLAVFATGGNSGGIGDKAGSRLPDHIALRVDNFVEFSRFLAQKGFPLEGDMLSAPGGLVLQFVEEHS